ncbi:unnamed protein product [Bathycoccus prasinos]
MNYQERSGFEPYDMSWNDDESTPRTDLGDLLNPTGEAYEMPESRSPTPIDTPDEPGDTEDEHDVPHPSQETDLKKDIHHNFSQVSNLASMLEGVESTTESVSQHKYSRLAQSSYDYFNSKGNADLVNTNLKNPKYSHINDLNGFELDKELSTLDDAVLHNKLTGETVISFRGTTSNIKETKAFLKDWEVNSKIMFNPKSAENTRRMKNAFSNTENVISKYGKDNLKVVGHSQGGYVSSSVAQKLDLEGHHYNPAISVRQINQNKKGMFFKNTAEQNIYKTHTDFASPLAYDRHIQKNFNVNTVNYNPEITERSPFVSTHSLEQFTPTVEEELGKGMVRCERNTLVSSFKNSLGPAVNVGAQAYSAGKDFQQDIKEGGGIGVETAKIGLDAAKNAEEYVVDNMIMDAGIAAAPETFGLSLLVAGAATVIHNLAVDSIVNVAKSTVNHSHHDDLRVDDELVVQNLKLPTNATVTGLTVNHIQGLSDSLGNLTIDESALLADVNTQIAGKADASSVYTQTELDTIHATFAPASTTYTKTQVDNGLTAKVDATTYDTGIALKADITALNATNTTLATKADASATTASLALKADLSTVNTSLDTKLDTSIFNTQIATKADLSSLQSTNTTLTQKANQTDVDTSLALKADLSALNSTNTTLTTKANITDMNSALALKVDTTDLDAINTSLTSKAPQTSLDTTNTNLGTLMSTVSSLTTAVNSEALIQNTNSDVIIPQRGIPYPPKNISSPTFQYSGDNMSPTAWSSYWTLSASDFTNVNGLRRKTYGLGLYRTENIASMSNFVIITLPYAVVATGIEAVRRADELAITSSSYQSWNVSTYNATNNSWVDLSMDTSVFETTGNPAYYPTQFRQITGNTLNSNKYRFPTGGDSAAKYFDGFRIYSKDESPPAIPRRMTLINRRIIKRPTLFATSRRNFGNLLTHYETGQDGTTPDPDPTPDPVAFTTSWSTNGGIVEANLTGISSHRTTEVIVLTRDDGTVLATLDENKVGDWDLQHDEGTGYGSYTYNVRLDGVIKSTFSRDYQPNVSSFTTNFFSNSAKRISCGVENISNPHDSYSVRLARPDDTILDTQVLNDATPFFLQFTESDYGTYDYKLLLSKWTTTSTSNPNIPPESYWVDTVIATHTQLFPRPEPTFTTSWTKSGLSITADLSSIVGAHPDFYAYLCRDDGTTLATHHFQTGQTTTSLSFTETDYGTFIYQLKLASFSTNELTLTTGITSIINAHNSFTITLERDDGTELSTHTLAEGETSFTFTQTETSYATFNYIVKINGAQTDTYSATYTPPPTPTFDIALTNDDLAITATLTNIVNPDPYYTLMIHDANDTHLDGHTFATGDTTATLSWTETSYGEKIYTKLLNGASIGTEMITLTDPNASTPTVFPSQINITGGAWVNNIFNLDVSKSTTTSKYYELDVYIHNGFEFRNEAGNTVVYPNTDDNTGQPNYVSFSNPITSDSRFGVSSIESLTLTSSDVGSTLHLYASHDNSLWMSFVISADLIFSSSSTPPPTQITDLFASHASGGEYGPSGVYTVIHSSSTPTLFVWQLGNSAWGGLLADHTISYDTNSKIWADVGSGNPYYVCDGFTWADTTASSANQQTLSFWQNSTHVVFELTNPYYEPVEPQTLTNIDSSAMWNHLIYKHRTSTTAEEIYDLWSPTNNDFEASTDDSILSIAVEKSTNTWKDYGTNVPDSVVENTDGTVSVLDASNVLRYKFTKPTSASWIVEPQTLDGLDGNSQWPPSTYIYKWDYSTSTHEVYSLAHTNGTWANPGQSIQVNKSTNTWEDASGDDGSGYPHVITEQTDGIVVLSGTGYPNLYKFTKPTTASWL